MNLITELMGLVKIYPLWPMIGACVLGIYLLIISRQRIVYCRYRKQKRLFEGSFLFALCSVFFWGTWCLISLSKNYLADFGVAYKALVSFLIASIVFFLAGKHQLINKRNR